MTNEQIAETLTDFVNFNNPIFEELRNSNEDLSEAVSLVFSEIWKKYSPSVESPKEERKQVEKEQVVFETQFENLTNIQLQDEIDTQKELIELYDDPEDPDSIEAEAKLLELELELENRLK